MPSNWNILHFKAEHHSQKRFTCINQIIKFSKGVSGGWEIATTRQALHSVRERLEENLEQILIRASPQRKVPARSKINTDPELYRCRDRKICTAHLTVIILTIKYFLKSVSGIAF